MSGCHAEVRHRTRDARCWNTVRKGFESGFAKVLQTLRDLPEVQWQQSYVTGDKLYCVYIAPNEALIKAHARQSGFAANRIAQVTAIIDPTTAE